VYATLGTVVSSVPAWRELLDALDTLDVDTVATVGSQIDVEQLGTIPANVRVERYVPQSYVLERVAVVASHAGAGTMLAGAARGLPQLCVPMGADQWANADALTAAGASITLEEDQRDGAAMRAGLQRLLTEPAFSAAAERVAAEIADLPHPDDYLSTLETIAGR
jgi:UDP:flavonoid glycosyltransferase YjiC (YdhE family)